LLPGAVSLIPEWIPAAGDEGEGVAPAAFTDFAHFVEPTYPRALRRRGVEGFVELIIRVDAQGRVIDWEVTDFGPVPAFKEEVERVAGRWRFSPAEISGMGGSTLTSRRVRIEFKLE